MRIGPGCAAALALTILLAMGAGAQSSGPGAPAPGPGCECGKHPPGQPPDRTVVPYAGQPADLQPYAKFSQPYDLNYTTPNRYFGAGRDIAEPTDLQRSADRFHRAYR